MGVKWNGRKPSQMAAQFQNIPKELENGSAEVIKVVIGHGELLMKDYIATRGTGYVGKGARATPDGRIDSGEMYDAVSSAMYGKRSGKFGWGVAGKGVKHYFSLQEYQPTPRGFPPMHALTDAFVKVREEFERKMKRMLKDATK